MDSFAPIMPPSAEYKFMPPNHPSPSPEILSSFFIAVILTITALVIIMIILWEMSRHYRTHPPHGDIELAPLVRVRMEEIRTFLFQSAVDTPHSDEKCPWCVYEFAEGDELGALPPCGHVYHSACIAEFLERETTCSVCRRTISLPYATDVAAAAADDDDDISTDDDVAAADDI